MAVRYAVRHFEADLDGFNTLYFESFHFLSWQQRKMMQSTRPMPPYGRQREIEKYVNINDKKKVTTFIAQNNVIVQTRDVEAAAVEAVLFLWKHEKSTTSAST